MTISKSSETYTNTLSYWSVTQITNHNDLINEAIHNFYHENTELEMELKDYFNDVQNKAQAFDRYLSKQKSNIDKLKRKIMLANNITAKNFMEYVALKEIVDELESYLK